jgi:hypothetical protein
VWCDIKRIEQEKRLSQRNFVKVFLCRKVAKVPQKQQMHLMLTEKSIAWKADEKSSFISC